MKRSYLLALALVAITLFISDLTFAQSNNALNFDGVNDHVSLGTPSALDFGTGNFSVITWFKTTASSGFTRLVSKGFWGETVGYLITLGSDGKLYFWISSGGGLSTSAAPYTTSGFNDGKWHYGVFVCDRTNNRVKIYVDGYLQNIGSYGGGTVVNGNELNITGLSLLNATSADPTIIGCYSGGSNSNAEFFNGLQDETSFWNTALTLPQVQSYINSHLGGTETGLVSYYRYNQGTAGGSNSGVTSLTDGTSNSLTGTLNGFALSGSTSNWVGGYGLMVPTSQSATSVTSTSFTANWTAANSVYGTVDNYLLEVSTDANFTSLVSGYNPQTLAGDATSSSVTGLSESTTYYYRVRAYSSSLGYAPNSFVQSPATPLPVELTTFRANTNGSSVMLNWQTATEVDNYGFEIESSVGGQRTANASSDNWTLNAESWTKIGFANGYGNSNSPKDYFFTDNKVTSSGKYCYRLKQVDTDGSFEYSDIVEVDFGQPNKFELMQNYPNPFNPRTVISYQLSASSNVALKIYDVLGNEIAVLIDNEWQEIGKYNYQFAVGESIDNSPFSIVNSQFPSGVYFYKLEAGSFIQVRKMIITK